MDTTKINSKIKELIDSMTIEEKSAIIHGSELFKTGSVERLNIPKLSMSDGPMGVRKEYKCDSWKPIDNSDDYVTYFPCNMALASTWNTDLAFAFGNALGLETRGRGKDVILAPGINIVRTPLCGRNFEYMSEDPYLISKLAVPLIKGVQQNDVAACVKHFALNNQESDRGNINVVVDDRALNEIYLPGFKAAIEEGDSYTIMGAYNRYNWAFCCENNLLMNKLLRYDWKFDGVVISDWGAVHDTVAAANNGLDIEMNVTNNFDGYFFAKPLIERVKTGLIDEKVIDEKVERILKLMFKLNIFTNNRKKGAYNTIASREVALKVAEESIVLLKNDRNLLPIDEKSIKSIAVIGDNANRLHSSGGGSAEIKALYEISPLMGLKMQLGGNIKISYAQGYLKEEVTTEQLRQSFKLDPLSQKTPEVQFQEATDRAKFSEGNNREKLRRAAIELAKKCDTVIFFGGLSHDLDTEGPDKIDMNLPGGQDELIKELLKINKNTIIVNISGSTVDMEGWIEESSAVVQCFYTGIEGGYALAKVLFGEINPSGKLPITFPKKLQDSPAHSIGEYPGDVKVEYKESIFVGYRYFDSYNVEPNFAFGHGLSYTTFVYSDLKIAKIKNDIVSEVNFKVSLNITNIGTREGAETVQLYISDVASSLSRPKQELKGFKKVFLEAGESKTVEFELDKTSLSFFNDVEGCWNCEAGDFRVLVGSSSRDIRLKDTIKINKTIKY